MRIQDNMFLFENLADLDNRSIQILSARWSKSMAYALKAVLEPVVEKFWPTCPSAKARCF